MITESVITLKELSRLSGFSVSTVSKALNNKFDISQETRSLIKEIAEKYDYVPNNYAVGLRKRRTQNIAVIIPQANTEFYSCFLYNIIEVASLHNYKIILFQSFEEDEKEKEYIRKSNDGSVDGVIVLTKNQLAAKRYKTDSNLPVECIKIPKSLSTKSLKKDCFNGFTELLKNIA